MIEEKKLGNSMSEEENDLLRMKVARIENITKFKTMKS